MVTPDRRNSHFDRNTQATNAGKVKLQAIHYFCVYPLIPILCASLLPIAGAIFVVASFQRFEDSTPYVIAGLLVVVFAFAGWMPKTSYVAELLREGDTCPAVVVDPSQGLIAVWADMTTSPDRYVPAIKIMHVPFSRVGLPGVPSKGNRLTTVAVYRGSGESGHWDDVEPIPVVCATTDSAQIARSLASVPLHEWDALTAGLELVPTPFRPGMYFV